MDPNNAVSHRIPQLPAFDFSGTMLMQLSLFSLKFPERRRTLCLHFLHVEDSVGKFKDWVRTPTRVYSGTTVILMFTNLSFQNSGFVHTGHEVVALHASTVSNVGMLSI